MKWFFSLCLLLLFFLYAPHRLAADNELAIQKVIDGETIELNDGRKVHLIGVNTTEVIPVLKNRFKLSPEKIASLPIQTINANAMTYIEKHAKGKNIILSFDPSHKAHNYLDSQGRLLAYVWYTTYYSVSAEMQGEANYLGIKAQDRLLNQEIIMLGLALTDDSSKFLQKNSFLEAEKDAARARFGFWKTAADIYRDMMKQAKHAQFGAKAGFIPRSAQASSLESARQTYSDLIKMNPLDYRSYYERSWLGANKIQEKISAENVRDIEQATSLSDFDPKLFMQKHYLLRLLGHHEEAQKAYAKAIEIIAKLGMVPNVSRTVTFKINESDLAELKKENQSLLEDALRATLNEEHFLIFMARIKDMKNTKQAQKFVKAVDSMGNFKFFASKYEDILQAANGRVILGETYWAKSGHDFSEGVIRSMETPGEMTLDLEEPGKTSHVSKQNITTEADKNTIMVKQEEEKDDGASQAKFV